MVERDEEITDIEKLIVHLAELAEPFPFLSDYNILRVDFPTKPFLVMDEEAFDKLFKSVVGE